MWSTFDFASALFVLAVVIGLINARFVRLPQPIALLIGGLILSALLMLASHLLPHADLADRSEQRLAGADLPAVLLDGVLALLLFATSLTTDIGGLKRRARPIFLLATLGVGISMALFGLGIHLMLGYAGVDIPLSWCLVLGAILAPTDAVVVEQLLAHAPLPERVRDLITGESLFNDGAAVVFYFAALAEATGQDSVIVGHGHLILRLIVDGGGGVLIGFAGGWLARRALRSARDEHLVVIISLALVLATYRIAVSFGMSGPIAVVVAGLTLCHWRSDGEERWRSKMYDFWSTTDVILNTLLFLLMGVEVLEIPFDAAGFWPLVAAIPLALLVRLVSVAVPLGFGRHDPDDLRRTIPILTWGGLRGGISIALVLALPPSPYRETLTAICYAVVIFTVVVQGLTMPTLVRRLTRRKA